MVETEKRNKKNISHPLDLEMRDTIKVLFSELNEKFRRLSSLLPSNLNQRESRRIDHRLQWKGLFMFIPSVFEGKRRPCDPRDRLNPDL
ncbi:hypothetical protein TNCV_1968541 [Trichonephila clavipes]|nr:hypothetical protein TNCV_1968541 [Trichonephila clavipes]